MDRSIFLWLHMGYRSHPSNRKGKNIVGEGTPWRLFGRSRVLRYTGWIAPVLPDFKSTENFGLEISGFCGARLKLTCAFSCSGAPLFLFTSSPHEGL